jgi:hypothetical protein
MYSVICFTYFVEIQNGRLIKPCWVIPFFIHIDPLLSLIYTSRHPINRFTDFVDIRYERFSPRIVRKFQFAAILIHNKV